MFSNDWWRTGGAHSERSVARFGTESRTSKHSIFFLFSMNPFSNNMHISNVLFSDHKTNRKLSESNNRQRQRDKRIQREIQYKVNFGILFDF